MVLDKQSILLKMIADTANIPFAPYSGSPLYFGQRFASGTCCTLVSQIADSLLVLPQMENRRISESLYRKTRHEDTSQT